MDNYGRGSGMRCKAPVAPHGHSMQATGNAEARPEARSECSSYCFSAPKRQAGFTLAEMLVVLVIVGLSVSYVSTSFERTLSIAHEKQWVEKTLRELNRVKVKAILTGRMQQVVLDFSAGTLHLTDGLVEQDIFSLPEKYAYTSIQPDGETERLRITFFPDGSATESRFDLIAPNTGRSHFRVRGLTGQVELLAAGEA